MGKADYFIAAEAIKAIAHPIRLEVIDILRNKELSVSIIQAKLKAKQSITSQHLIVMKNKKILQSRRDGNVIYYSIKNKNILKIIQCIDSCKSYKEEEKNV
ncbi:MAG: helix-turn-helix transcriptional regulator [Candidatus Aureabacteria bacterium]|nr:helix-turn-helix transcriptional regulator [Candidatus Auribacterota bacterium]